jgi:hypothetical protein
MKNKLIKMLGVTAAVVALTQTLQAVPITGNIGFQGSVQLNTGSAATATQVINWLSPSVGVGASGAFSSILPGTSVTFTAPWTFASGLSPLWSVGGFTFNLITSMETTTVVNGKGYINVSGSGTVVSTNPSYDPTTLTWSFSTQDPSSGTVGGLPTFTFSASANSIPDGGTTIMLLGAALSGVALLKRKLVA